MTEAPRDTARVNYGPTILDGKLRYLSVSAVEKADDATEKGCPRRWLGHYGPLKLRDPQTKAQERGQTIHTELEVYLEGGPRPTISDVIRGMHMVPEPGPGLRIEHSIVRIDADNNADLSSAKLFAAGLPFVGFIDVENTRGYTYLDGAEGNIVRDPDGTVEVLDWKSCKDLRYVKRGIELTQSIQMAGYGKYEIAENNPRKIRLSHGYYPIKGRPIKTSILVSPDAVQERWEHVDVLAGYLKGAAGEISLDNVRYNLSACNSFGKPCPVMVAGECAAHTSTSVLTSIFGLEAADELLDLYTPTDRLLPTSSLMKKFKIADTSTSTTATSGPSPAVQAEMTRLQSEERTALVVKTRDAILKCKMGFPRVAFGQLSKELHTLEGGGKIGAIPYPGEGEIGENVVETLEELIEAAKEVAGEHERRKAAARKTSIISPDSPPPPTKASLNTPVAVESPPAEFEEAPDTAISAVAAAAAIGKAKNLAKKAAKAKLLEEAAASEGKIVEIDPEVEAPLRRTREETIERMVAAGTAPADAEAVAEFAEAVREMPIEDGLPVQSPAADLVETIRTLQGARDLPQLLRVDVDSLTFTGLNDLVDEVAKMLVDASPTDKMAALLRLGAFTLPTAEVPTVVPTAVNLFVDCQPSIPTLSFWTIVDDAMAKLARQVGAPDVRLADESTPGGKKVSFGKWKSVLQAYLREAKIPPGDYTFDTAAGGEVSAVVLETMRSVVAKTGGLYVRGAR